MSHTDGSVCISRRSFVDYTNRECIITRELSSKVLSVVYVMSRHLSHDDHNFSLVRRIFFNSGVVVAELKRKIL